MKLFQYDSPLMSFLSRLGDLILLNLLWLVCCLPVVTAGASTTALYYCLLHLDGEKESGGVFSWFFSAFKSNFRRSIWLLLIWAATVFLIGFDMWYYIALPTELPVAMRLLLLVPAVLLWMSVNFLFPLQAQFDNSLWGTVKNALLLTLTHLPSALVATMCIWAPMLLFLFATPLFFQTLPLWLLFGIALADYIGVFFLKKIFAKHIPSDEDA